MIPYHDQINDCAVPGQPPFLCEIHPLDMPRWPFHDFVFKGFDPRFSALFYETFRMRYNGRRLGTQLPDLFANWCNARFLEKSSYYQQLLKSIDIIENPFINQYIATSDRTNTAARNKTFSTNQSLDVSDAQKNSASLGLSYDASTATENGGQTNRSDTRTNERDLSRNTNDQTVNENENYKFSDTPQQSVSTSDEDVQTGWDSSYLTTASNDQKQTATVQSQIGASSRAGRSYDWKTQLSTNTRADVRAGESDNVSNDEQHSHAQHTGNSEIAGVRVTESNLAHSTEGLSNVLVSDAVMSWRRTMFPLVEQMLNDYAELFLSVY